MPGLKLFTISALAILCFVIGKDTKADASQTSVSLVGHAVLAADTFTSGPPSGQYSAEAQRRAAPRFPSQPVQGFSDLAFITWPDTSAWMALSDNGYGTKANSADFQLAFHYLTAERLEEYATQDKHVEHGDINTFPLRDPQRNYPYPIINENTPERILTGYDLDPESLALRKDGSFWVGDEFGPFLLRFDQDGALEACYGLPGVRSPQHPSLVAAGPQPGMVSPATLPSSGGFEGIALTPDETRLYALLEKPVLGDDPRLLRILEFDTEQSTFTQRPLRYMLESPQHAIGELEGIDANRYLVIERDNLEGAAAQFKRIYEIDLSQANPQGIVPKRLVVDLLEIADPNNIGGYGPVFRFPFITIESVHLLEDGQTLLVCNDNNYDGGGGRGKGMKDNTELIWLRLPQPLR